MFCPKCGAKVDSNAGFCSECGASLKGETSVTQTTTVSENEGLTFGWGVLGFFIPLAGLILFIMWKQERPKASKSAGIGALISVILNVVICILAFAFAFYLGFTESASSIYY